MNDPLPVCSICIANFNGEGMLADCLDSVFSQELDASIEVLVHDDASTDASLAVLARYPGVVVIASDQNVGFCIANNRMAQRARGDYLLLLNNDAALMPGALATLLDASRQQNPSGILTLPQYDWHSGDLVDRGCGLDVFYNPVPNLSTTRADVAMVIGACLFIRRDTWVALTGFPEWFESIGEDLYLCCVARLRGLPVQVAARSGYRHRQGASFSGERSSSSRPQTTFRRRRLSERNKTWTMVICTPTVALCLILPVHIVVLAIEGLALTTFWRDKRIWKDVYAPAISQALWHNQQVRDTRRQIQASRRIGLRAYLRTFVVVPFKLRALLRRGVPTLK
jgi:GT2 family glycosyltransferase